METSLVVNEMGGKTDLPIGFGLELQDFEMCLWCFYLFILKKLCLKKVT